MTRNYTDDIHEYEDCLRFVAPCTFRLVDHADGDRTLEGECCQAEADPQWVADVEHRIRIVERNQPGRVSRELLPIWAHRMERATTADELRAGFELFEATLDGIVAELRDWAWEGASEEDRQFSDGWSR